MALSVRDDAFLQRLLHYSPEPRYVQVNLQLFGMPGHGKSSLINTCLRIVHGGSFENTAGSGRSNHPITMDRKDYRLTAKVLITDNRGVNKMSLEEQEEIAAQMSQLRGRDRVEWDRSLRQKVNLIREQFRNRPMEIVVPVFVYSAESLLTDERYEEMEPFIRGAHNITGSLRGLGEVTWEKDNLEVTLDQLPHKYTDHPKDLILPVLVYSAISALGEDDMANMEKLITNSFRITGIHPIVVITKCSSDKSEEVKKKFGNLGVMKRICLENYTENNFERTEEKDQKILEFVNMCIQEAERGLKMRQNEDPQTRFITQATQQVKLESDILRKKIIPPRKKFLWFF